MIRPCRPAEPTIAIEARIRSRRWQLAAVALVPSLNVVAFLQPLATDPVPAGLVVGWNMVLLGGFLFPGRDSVARPAAAAPGGDHPLQIWLAGNGPAVRHAALVGLVATIAIVGYRVGETGLVRTVALAGDLALVALAMPYLFGLARRRRLLAMAGLITLGGLGFVVLASAWLRLSGQRRPGLEVQVKVVLVGSLALVLIGWLGFGVVEWNGSLADMGVGDRLVNALFASVTARTAGFNSVPMDGLQPATTLLLMASQPGDFQTLLFEAVSAFGTVGLSLGATTSLDAIGKGVVIVIMLAGRIGPLSLALLLGRTVGARFGYPEATLMVG